MLLAGPPLDAQPHRQLVRRQAKLNAGLKGRGWHPFLGIGYGLRTDTTLAQLTSEGIDFRVRAPLHRHLKFDVRPRSTFGCVKSASSCARRLRIDVIALQVSGMHDRLQRPLQEAAVTLTAMHTTRSKLPLHRAVLLSILR